MSGGLAIKVGGDISGFQKSMAQAGDLAKRQAIDIATNFQGAAGKINAAFAGIQGLQQLPAQLSAAKAAAIGVAGTGALVLGAYALVSSSIKQANEQLNRFIKLGENAASANIGVEFFQRFSEAAEKAKLDVAEIEAALKKAGSVVTPKFDEQDAIKTRLSQIFETGYLGEFQSKGLDAYRAAGDNEERIRATVTAMQELEQLGERLAAIDLAERLFGSATAERIRSGRLEIDAIAASLDRQRDDIITQEQVAQATEFRERLDEAYKTIDEFFHVSVALEGSGRAVLDAWLMIAEAVAKATGNVGSFYDKVQDAQGILGNMFSTTAGIIVGLGKIAAENRNDQIAGSRTIYDKPIGPEFPAAQPNQIIAPPAPPRRPLSFYTEKQAEPRSGGKSPSASASPAESLDAVENYLNSLTRTTAAVKAEVDAIGLSNTEKLAAINLAKAEELARQNNLTLSAAQIAKIKETSTATAEYRDRLDEVRDQQEHLRSISNTVLSGIVSDARNGVTGLQALYNALNRVMDRLADKAVNSLTDSLFGSSGGTGGGILSSLFRLGASAATGGTSNFAGQAAGAIGPFPMPAATGYVPGYATGHVRGEATTSPSPIPGFATGRTPRAPRTSATLTREGIIRGPGTPTSDSILARLSTDEAIIRASSVDRYGATFIRAINEGTFVVPDVDKGERPPGFATGRVPPGAVDARRRAVIEAVSTGRVPAPSTATATAAAAVASGGQAQAAPNVITLAPSVTLHASGGTNEQNNDLAGKVGKQLKEVMEGMIGKALRNATRPGGILRG